MTLRQGYAHRMIRCSSLFQGTAVLHTIRDACTALSDTAAQHQKSICRRSLQQRITLRRFPCVSFTIKHGRTDFCGSKLPVKSDILPRSLCRAQMLIPQRSDIRSYININAHSQKPIRTKYISYIIQYPAAFVK